MATNKDLEIFDKALSTYGIDKQKWMLVEECGELLNALAKHIRGRCSLMNLTPNLQTFPSWLNRLQGFMVGKSFLKSVQEKLNVLKTDYIHSHERERLRLG
jgi:hypothetical protein